jgi:hypothetical protein
MVFSAADADRVVETIDTILAALPPDLPPDPA